MSRLILLVLALPACGGLDTYAVPPSEGTWTFHVLDTDVDQCRVSDERSGAAVALGVSEFDVGPGNDDTTFTLAIDGGEPALCTIDGETFSCRPSVMRDRASDTVTLSVALTASGWIDGQGFLDGDFVVDVRCTGADCKGYSQQSAVSVPCRTEGSFDAKLAD